MASCEAPEHEPERPKPSESTPLLGVSPPKDDDWVSEVRLLVRYSLPLIVTYLLQYSGYIIITFMAGHLSAHDLAAASIGMTTMNIIGYAIFEGMATALDTLCSQVYGSGNMTGVGLHVQRMLILMGLTAIPIASIWAASPWILPHFLQESQADLAVTAGTFLRINIIGIPGYASFEAIKRFLQAQGSFKLATFVLIVCTPVNVFLSWLFGFKLGMGLTGAALGVALTNNLRPILLVIFIMMPTGRWSHKCWGGFSRAALTDFKHMAKLAFAGSSVNIAEWGALQILMFTTSRLGTDYLAAQTVLTTISVMAWHIPFSLGISTTTRIGHLIGAGLVQTARNTAKVYALAFLCLGCFDGLVIYLLRDNILQFFLDINDHTTDGVPSQPTSDSSVYAIASATILSVCVYHALDSFICFTNGVLRGLARQHVAACVVIAVNYCAAVPIAVWLELGPPNLGLNGVWLGIAAGMVLIAGIECFYMRITKWQNCVDDVRDREGF
ncbi:MATE efflux family protein [Xylaria palmicola]|nr:MATE efflux family protein [Xylaria palmicola]